MAGKDLNYRITVDQAAGSAGIRDFSRTVTSELRKVDQAMTDTGTASQRAAALLNDMASKAETELKQASAAADALAQALGPEMAAKMGANGIAQAVGDLNRMGVTFEEIEADADQLAAAIKRVDDVQVSAVDAGLGNMSGKLREVRDEADQSGSVLANMAGNSAQSLTGAAGVAGDLGMALGQVAEYATEGNIKIGNLAQVAGPMAMLAVATQAFSSVMEGIDFSKTFKAEQVKNWTEALQAGETVLSHLEDTARKAELQVDSAGGGFLGLSRHAEDLNPHLQKLNLSVEDFARLVAQGSPELAKMRTEYGRLVNLGPQATDAQTELGNSMQYVIAAAEDQRDAIKSANDETARIAEITKPSTQAVADAVEAWKTLKDPVSAMPDVFDRVAAALRDGVVPAAADVDAIMDQTGMTMSDVFDTAQGLNDKLADTKSAMDDTASATDLMRRRTEELDRQWAILTGTLDDESAFLSIQDAFDDVRTKGAEAWDAARKGADDAEQKSRDYEQSVISAKEQVLALGRQIGLSVPETKKLLLQIDDHQIDDVERQLNIMARNRTMNLSIIASGGNGYVTQTKPPSSGAVPGMAPVGPEAFGVGVGADPFAAPLTPDVVFPVTVAAAGPAMPANLTLDMRGSVLGSRYDITKTVRLAVRDGVRLAGARNVLR